jgi:hypothetical protein
MMKYGKSGSSDEDGSGSGFGSDNETEDEEEEEEYQVLLNRVPNAGRCYAHSEGGRSTGYFE